jgi:hypothetical protein
MWTSGRIRLIQILAIQFSVSATSGCTYLLQLVARNRAWHCCVLDWFQRTRVCQETQNGFPQPLEAPGRFKMWDPEPHRFRQALRPAAPDHARLGSENRTDFDGRATLSDLMPDPVLHPNDHVQLLKFEAVLCAFTAPFPPARSLHQLALQLPRTTTAPDENDNPPETLAPFSRSPEAGPLLPPSLTRNTIVSPATTVASDAMLSTLSFDFSFSSALSTSR